MEHEKTTVNFSLEEKLLLCCARTHMDSLNKHKFLSLVTKDINWSELLKKAVQHKQLPLLNLHFNQYSEYIPQDVLDKLKDAFDENVKRNFILTWNLFEIVQLLKTNDITVIPYKGPSLAFLAYKNLDLREFYDLDIFIEKKDMVKAKELLIPRGYVPDVQLNADQEDLYVKFQREYRMIHEETGIRLEFHCGLYYPNKDNPLYDPEHLESININGFKFLSFAPEELLLILSIHSSGHLWNNLGWMCDIAELINSNKDMNWDKIINKAKIMGIERILFISLFLVKDLLGTEIPERMVSILDSDKNLKKISMHVEKTLFIPEDKTTFKNAFSRIKLRENIGYGIRDCILLIITPTPFELKTINLSKSLSFLYYIIRPIFLLKRYKLKLFKM